MPEDDDERQRRRDRRYGRETIEFGRVLGLSDSVFGIALTLLVFTLDASTVRLTGLSGVLTDQTGQLIAFGVSFAVIANFWWVHHRFFASLGLVEPGLVRLNLLLLGAVALVPFPTSLLGRDPTVRGAVVPYLVLLSLVAVVHLLLLVRANAAEAWRGPMPDGMFRWLLAGWGASAVVTLLALGVAFLLPVAALAMLLLTWPVEALVAYRAPAGYRDWG
ncbi:TMEM175 family protein [Georgenia sp. 10Sc9-8]|uniref:TMEM175 family protein n=1 Tax=Georgenia halotolerans TaxID=3028317 RepID=A0ABT5TYH9_9MICO|nr:TMEM175 family protein [Georgenia halotolerans]